MDIIHSVTIEASAQKVYEALTQAHHIKLWWTPDCTVDENVGGRARFEFNPYDDYVAVEILTLEPSKRVVWKCDDARMLKVDDWVGTTITFDLSEDNGATTISFFHTDWPGKTACYDRCTDGWHHFVCDSLKLYLETGTGKPFDPTAAE